MVIGLRNTGGAVCAAMLSVACALTAGCGVTASTASPAVLHLAARTRPARTGPARTGSARTGPTGICADELTSPSKAQQAAIDRYWTPLARSALKLVSEGKMMVSVPKKHLTRAQRQALRRAERAEQALTPKPKLVCVPSPRTRASESAAPASAQSHAPAPGSGG